MRDTFKYNMLLIFALAATALSAAQSTPSASLPKPPVTAAPSAAPAPADESASVPATAPVITIHGMCKAAAKSAGCTTVITKAQFEKLISAVNTGNQAISPVMRRNMAQSYVDLLAFVQAASRAGIENDPKFQEAMRVVRLQKMAEFYRRSLEEKSKTSTPAEIQSFYDKNQARYDELTLSRVFLPKTNPTAKDKDAWDKKAAQVADDIREQAAKGGNLEKLQKDAYTTLELTTPAPPSAVGARRRGQLPALEEDTAFALKAGEVSKVITEPHAYVIFKLESRQTLPLDKVKEEISRELFRQKLEAKTKAITGTVRTDLNDRYFAMPAVHSGPPVPMTPGKPSAAPKPDSHP